MMATVLHVTSGLGLRKFQADGFLLTQVYISCKSTKTDPSMPKHAFKWTHMTNFPFSFV